MNLEELKKKSPAELITQAEKLEVENPSTLRKQEILFAILKKLAQKNEQIIGGGTLEVLQDGFGFLRLRFACTIVSFPEFLSGSHPKQNCSPQNSFMFRWNLVHG